MISKDMLIELYISQHISARQIALKYNTNITKITTLLKRYQIPIRIGSDRNQYTNDKFSREWLINQYIRNGKSKQQLGRETGNPSGETISKYIKMYDLDILRYRYRSFVLHILAKQYINSDKTLKQLCECKSWLRIEHLSDKVKQLGGKIKPTNCYPKRKYNKSRVELSILDFVRNYYPNAVSGYMIPDISLSRRTIDIYIPELSLGIEVNGIFYHSIHNGFTKYIHKQKKDDAANNGIDLIYLWEDDIKNKPDIIKSMLLNRFNMSKTIYGRKCDIIELKQSNIKNQFLDDNHIQGRCRSTVALALIHNQQIVAVMSFLYDNNKKAYELNRFCNLLNHTVIGGFSKLLSHFVNNFSDQIVSYSHNDFSNGNVYKNNNFKLIRINPPSYTYYNVNGKLTRQHRLSFTKNNLIKKYNLDPKMKDYNEDQIVDYINGLTKTPTLLKIYDCGTTTWHYITKKEAEASL